MNDIKIILLCSSGFALPVLRELAFFKMLSVVAVPRHCKEMLLNVEMALTGTGISVLELDKVTFANQLRVAIEENEINLGLVMMFPYRIPSSVYGLPSKGFYNFHPGPLPQYRGIDPVFQQLENKEKHAGVTVHKLDEGICTGPLVMGEMIKIDPMVTHDILTAHLANLAAKLTGILVRLVSFGVTITSRPQDETKERYYKRP